MIFFQHLQCQKFIHLCTFPPTTFLTKTLAYRSQSCFESRTVQIAGHQFATAPRDFVVAPRTFSSVILCSLHPPLIFQNQTSTVINTKLLTSHSERTNTEVCHFMFSQCIFKVNHIYLPTNALNCIKLRRLKSTRTCINILKDN